MKVKCLKNVCASGSALEAGETYDISDRDFELLSSMGKVIQAPIEVPKPKKPTAKKK